MISGMICDYGLVKAARRIFIMSGISTYSHWLKNFGIAIGSTCAFSTTCVAQIIPDSTLPNNSRVTTQDNIRIIERGTQAGSNLFHSFEQFSVPTRSSAFFNNTLDIQNIITRVTGSSISNIDGLIRANGRANLFLINPNGIVFGPNALLNVGGSFFASTASAVKFADGTEFSATTPQTTPLLTVSVPIGLQFGQTQGKILVQAVPPTTNFPPLTSPPSVTETLEFVNTRLRDIFSRPTQLQVLPGRTLALVGGDIDIESGNLTALGGRIELGSVASPSLVSLTPTIQGWALGYEGVQNFRNIQLSGAATVNASGNGGGDIQVRGGQVTATNQSVIFAGTLGNQNGGDIYIGARQLNINNGSIVGTGTTAIGNSGNLIIETQNLNIQDGGVVETGTEGVGNAGNLTIRATDSVNIVNRGLIATGSLNQGNAGQLTIDTKTLSIFNAGQVLNATSSSGKGGSLAVTASESVEIGGAQSFLFTDTFGLETAGDLTITTKKLIVRDGGQVSSASLGIGSAGNLVVNASESVELSGIAKIPLISGERPIPSGLFASSGLEGSRFIGTGVGGNLKINTGNLVVRDGAQVSVSSLGSSVAGQLQVQARSIDLDNQGQLIAETASGNGGNIRLDLQDLLLLRDKSQISTTAGRENAGGDGGNITINAPNGFIVSVLGDNSDISANAFTGRGGKINITASGIYGIQSRAQPTLESDITASSERGVAGVVEFNTSGIDPMQGLVELPTGLVDNIKLIASSCNAFAGSEASTFVVTGRGGVPPSPDEPLSSDVVWSDTRLPNITVQQYRSEKPTNKPSKPKSVEIVPATGWVFNDKGEVTLISSASNATAFKATPASCPQR
ncbi:filamentous hemagglutinin family outer membrane protein [Tolypothrix sp. NIES-4075]|nr:filamentous hemagglutinin family outer membrane protein [Tolypothrix sp. NIES-4075]